MKIRLDLTIRSNELNERLETNGIIKYEDIKTISFMEDPSTKVEYKINQDSVIINRFSDIKSSYEFIENKQTSCFLISKYGKIQLTIYTSKLKISDNEIVIKYKVIENSEPSNWININLKYN